MNKNTEKNTNANTLLLGQSLDELIDGLADLRLRRLGQVNVDDALGRRLSRRRRLLPLHLLSSATFARLFC